MVPMSLVVKEKLEMASKTCTTTSLRSLQKKDVEWHCQPFVKLHFHPPICHMSGVWEQFIRSICSTMKAILCHPNAFVTRETLRTILVETARILNSWPLCPRSDYPKSSHLLQPRQGMRFPRREPVFPQAMGKESNSLKPLLGQMAAPMPTPAAGTQEVDPQTTQPGSQQPGPHCYRECPLWSLVGRPSYKGVP